MAKDNSELIDVNSDVKDRVMEVSHIQSLIYLSLIHISEPTRRS